MADTQQKAGVAAGKGGELTADEAAAKGTLSAKEREAGVTGEPEVEDELIVVKSALGDENEVALFEQDERHPSGEVYITGVSGEVEVYPTPGVTKAIGQGRLEELGEDEEEESVAARATAAKT